MRRLLSAFALLLFAGCATPTSSTRDDSTGYAGGAEKKEEHCVKEFLVGSRLPYYICEGDPPPHNIASMGQQELRDRMSRSVRPGTTAN